MCTLALALLGKRTLFLHQLQEIAFFINKLCYPHPQYGESIAEPLYTTKEVSIISHGTSFINFVP